MTRDQWLDAATSEIRFSPDRQRVRQELEDHMLDRIDAARDQGMDWQEATAAAVTAMGDPEPLAKELGRLHSPWLGRVWYLSRILAVCAMIVLVLGFFSGELWSSLQVALLGYETWAPEIPPEQETVNGLIITRTGLWQDLDLGEQGGYHWQVPLAFAKYTAGQDAPDSGTYTMELRLTAKTARFWEPWANGDSVLAVTDSNGCQYSQRQFPGRTEPTPYTPHFYANGSPDGLGRSHATIYLRFMPDNRDLKWLELTIGDMVLRIDLEGGIRP